MLPRPPVPVALCAAAFGWDVPTGFSLEAVFGAETGLDARPGFDAGTGFGPPGDFDATAGFGAPAGFVLEPGFGGGVPVGADAVFEEPGLWRKLGFHDEGALAVAVVGLDGVGAGFDLLTGLGAVAGFAEVVGRLTVGGFGFCV